MAQKKSCKKSGGKLKLAATLVGLAAAGYYLHGPKGKQNRAKLKAWTVKAKGEVLEQFEKRKDVTEEQYKAIVDRTTRKYSKLKNVSSVEAKKFNKELMGHWKAIKKSVEKTPSKKV